MRRDIIRGQAQRRAYPKIDPAERGKERDCLCGCGKKVTGRKAFATDACRKKYQRAEDQKKSDAKTLVSEFAARRAAATADTGKAAEEGPTK